MREKKKRNFKTDVQQIQILFLIFVWPLKGPFMILFAVGL